MFMLVTIQIVLQHLLWLKRPTWERQSRLFALADQARPLGGGEPCFGIYNSLVVVPVLCLVADSKYDEGQAVDAEYL